MTVLDDPVTGRAPSEEEIVLSYVESRFMELGFNVRQAVELAERGADWHQADRLLRAGCDLLTALDILT